MPGDSGFTGAQKGVSTQLRAIEVDLPEELLVQQKIRSQAFFRYSNFGNDFSSSTHQEDEDEEEERQLAQMKIEMRKYKEKDK